MPILQNIKKLEITNGAVPMGWGSLSVSSDINLYIIHSNGVGVTLMTSWTVAPLGVPIEGTLFIFKYTAISTLNGNNITVFGKVLTQEEALRENMIECYYNGTAWDVSVYQDDSDITEAYHGVRITALTLAGMAPVALNPKLDKKFQKLTGNGNLTGNISYIPGGTPVECDEFVILYEGTVTYTGGFTITIMGATLTAQQALLGNLYIHSVYDGAAWVTNILEDGASHGVLPQGYIYRGDANNEPVAYNARTNAQILVGDGTTINSVAFTGDGTLTNAGVFTIDASDVAGAGLKDDGSENLELDIHSLTGAVVNITEDYFAFSDEDVANDPTRRELISDFIGLIAGDGITQNGATFQLDVDVDGVTIEFSGGGTLQDALWMPGAGLNSIVARNSGSTAAGANAFAVGNLCTADGIDSTALGFTTVASGGVSFACGSLTTASGAASSAFGITTTASGDYAFSCGSTTIASGNTSFATGGGTTASGVYSFTQGLSTVASGDYSFASGSSSIASGHYSHAFGSSSISKGDYSSAIGCESVSAWPCSEAISGSAFSDPGDAQHIRYIQKATTANAAATNLIFSDATNFIVPVDCAVNFKVDLIAINTTDDTAYSITFRGALKNIGGVTTFLGAVVATAAINDAGFTGTATIDTVGSEADDRLYIQVTGMALKTIRWVAYVDMTMVGYNAFNIV